MAASILYSKLRYESNYKLIQLTPDLLDALNSEHSLIFKAADPEQPVVLCSEDKTWILKQRNHSNTVLLLKEFVPDETKPLDNLAELESSAPSSHHLGFTKLSFELEPRTTEGQINFSSLPIYNGDPKQFLQTTSESQAKHWSLEDVKSCSPCSEKEFYGKWHNVGGCVVNEKACLLSQDFISRTLHITLMSCMAENLSLDDLELIRTFEAVNKDMDDAEDVTPFTKEMIETVLGKFCSHSSSDRWKLDKKLVTVWYGIIALKKFASRGMLSEDEFMIKWKSQFPPYFSCNLDFSVLRGHFYRPLGSGVQYLSISTLPSDIKDRFKHLFKLQSTWDLEDIKPFIEQLNTKGLKLDNFVMKYARRKRQGQARNGK